MIAITITLHVEKKPLAVIRGGKAEIPFGIPDGNKKQGVPLADRRIFIVKGIPD